jgi:hypothetical protein
MPAMLVSYIIILLIAGFGALDTDCLAIQRLT